MRRFTDAWIEAVGLKRFSGPWSSPRGPKLPILPWITVPLHPLIREFFETCGREVCFAPGEKFFPTTQVTHFVAVTSGLTGRGVAVLRDRSGAGAIALSTPGRFAAGNLNWVTRRPAIGRYCTLSQCTVRMIPHVEAEERILARDDANEFLRILYTQIELINLSDRMGFSVLALLSAPQRLQALFLAWAVFYGSIREEGGRHLVRMPSPGRRSHIEDVLSVSSVTMDKLSSHLHAEAAFERDGEFVVFDAAWLQEAHGWMRACDGDGVIYPRPKSVIDFLYGAEAGEYV